MPKKKARSYGKYTLEIDGELYACVRLPLGNGKYKRKVKKLEGANDRIQWALEELRLHKDGGAPQKEKMTFADLAKWYRKEFLVPPVYKDGKKLEGQRDYKGQINRLSLLERYFDGYKVEKITVDVLRRYKRERLKDVSVATVNRCLALLRTIFIKARKRKWIKENPFDYGEQLIEISLESKRDCPITDGIYKRLLARSRKSRQPLLYYFIIVMRHTGARPSEIHPFNARTGDGVQREPLTWKNVLLFDFKAVKLVSYKGRQRVERLVPSSFELEKALRELHRKTEPQSDDFVFPVASFKTGWNCLLASCRMKNIRIRDFRAFFNSKMMQRTDINDMERMLILGHKDISTNERYSSVDMKFVEKFRGAQEIETIQ